MNGDIVGWEKGREVPFADFQHRQTFYLESGYRRFVNVGNCPCAKCGAGEVLSIEFNFRPRDAFNYQFCTSCWSVWSEEPIFDDGGDVPPPARRTAVTDTAFSSAPATHQPTTKQRLLQAIVDGIPALDGCRIERSSSGKAFYLRRITAGGVETVAYFQNARIGEGWLTDYRRNGRGNFAALRQR